MVHGPLPPKKKKTPSKLKTAVKKVFPFRSFKKGNKKSGEASESVAPIASDASGSGDEAPKAKSEGAKAASKDKSTLSPPPVKVKNDDDEIEGGTDVLEVWFAGCHSGMSRERLSLYAC